MDFCVIPIWCGVGLMLIYILQGYSYDLICYNKFSAPRFLFYMFSIEVRIVI